jgi:hypothetical protein
MVFNPTGNKLWVKTEPGDVMALPVPNSPRMTPGKTKHYHTLSRFPQVAVGQTSRSTLLVSMNPASLTFRVAQFGKLLPFGLAEGEYEFVDARTRPLFQYGSLSLCVWHGEATQKPGLYLLDEAGALFRLYANETGKQCGEVVHTHALTLTRSRLGLCYAAYESVDGGQVRVLIDGHEPAQFWQSPEAPSQAFFGYGPAGDTPVYGQLALGHSKTRWEIHNLAGRTEIAVPEGFSVHGVVRDQNYEATLIVVEDDLRTLSLHGAHGTRRLVKANTAIITVSASHDLPLIAYGTEGGEISVYSLKHRKAVLDFVRSTI